MLLLGVVGEMFKVRPYFLGACKTEVLEGNVHGRT
jgi:hypothetical protein